MQDRIKKILLKLIPVIGVAILLKQYFINRSLWFDEALIAENIINLPVAGFFHQPLPNHQIAPLGFLLIEKLFIHLAGASEYTLRFYQLICGCFSIFLFSALVKKRLKDDLYVIIALLAFIILPTVIYFSCEVKPYGPDLFFTLVAYTVIGEAVLNDFGWRKAIGVGLLGAALLWVSFPVAFVLASIGITQLFSAAVQKKWEKLFKTFMAVLCWAFSFLLIQVFVLCHSMENNHFFVSYFHDFFINFTDLKSYVKVFNSILQYHGIVSHVLTWSLILLGSYFLYNDNKIWFFFLITPVLIAVILSGRHLYPLIDRLSLYLVPLMVLVIVRGIQGISLLSGRFKLIVALLISGVVFNHALTKTWGELIRPSLQSEAWGIEMYGHLRTRPSIAYIKSHARPGDIVYVSWHALKPFKYYQLRDHLVIGELDQKRFNIIPGKDKDILRGNKRVWVLYLYLNTGFGENFARDFLRSGFLKLGARLIDSQFDGGAGVYLFDCSYLQAGEKK